MAGNKTSIAAHVTGTVVTIEVAQGASIRCGDPLITIESMKMHCVLEAPCGGDVLQILVAPGDIVDEGQAVLVLQT